ncbi:MAG: HEAT repeat domain-containing protein, partial [Planctomycetota bacterium]|nr:HEAT repeat domain-containing protein [Planctomycetota bacterium]
MLGLFRAKAPLDVREKVWTEARFAWIVGHFGLQRFREAPDVAIKDCLPADFDGSESSVRRLYEHVCKHMGTSPSVVPLQVLGTGDPEASEGEQCGTGGCCGVRMPEIGEEVQTLAALARQIAGHQLAGYEPRNGGLDDTAYVGELLMVVLGLGVIPASAPATMLGRVANWNRWSINQLGNVPSRILGYAMALRCWLLDESRRPDLSSLGADARSAFAKGLKYLKKTGDSLLRPDNVHRPNSEPGIGQLIEQLKHESATFRLSAAWKLGDRGAIPRDAVANLTDCLRDNEAAIRAAAIQTLRLVDDPTQAPIDRIIDLVVDRSSEVRAAAAVALAHLKTPLDARSFAGEIYSDQLSVLMRDDVTRVRLAAAFSLGQYGESARPIADMLVAPLKKAVV